MPEEALQLLELPSHLNITPFFLFSVVGSLTVDTDSLSQQQALCARMCGHAPMHLCTYVSMQGYEEYLWHINKHFMFGADLCVLSLSLRKLHESVEKVSELQRTGFSNTGIGRLNQRLNHLRGGVD